MEWHSICMVWGTETTETKVGRLRKPPHTDPAKQAAREASTLKKQRQRAANKEKKKQILTTLCATAYGSQEVVAPHTAQGGGKRKADEAFDDSSWNTILTSLEIGVQEAEKEAAAAAAKEAEAERAAAVWVAAAELEANIEAAVEGAAATLVAAEIETATEAAIERMEEERAEAERVAAEQHAAAKAAKKKKAAETTAAREKRLLGKDRGFVEAPPKILTLTHPSEDKCPICLEDEKVDSNPPDSSMPCCHVHIHLACFMKWHAQAQQAPTVRGPNTHGGSKLILMETCRLCVWCKAKQGSARGPPRVRQLE
jgi:hypothetical protein